MSDPAHKLSHIPVLLREAVDTLDPRPGETVIDCTAGLGGHASAMAERIGPQSVLVLFDLDPINLDVAGTRIAALPRAPRVVTHHASFAEVGSRMKLSLEGGSGSGVDAAGRGDVASARGGGGGGDRGPVLPASVVLADLGFASPQVEDPARGFSFMRDGPLDMRLNPQAPISAAELVNSMPEPDLMELIRDYGEEPQNVARRIAAKVVQERKTGPILTTVRLAAVVRAAVPAALVAGSRIHPATKTFQALRIAVNDEIGSLERFLDALGRAAAMVAAGKETWLSPGARIGIISFHSLEDRPVKQKFAELVERGVAEPLTRKPIVASDEELAANPRSRSAKFRALRLRRDGS